MFLGSARTGGVEVPADTTTEWALTGTALCLSEPNLLADLMWETVKSSFDGYQYGKRVSKTETERKHPAFEMGMSLLIGSKLMCAVAQGYSDTERGCWGLTLFCRRGN